ncbi:MAG TPA: hypothetical protein EYP69_04095 [Bacteroidales bacterium]|nr:hypothetical protein [Bacteroidales bacterium]
MDFKIISFDLPDIIFSIHCSSGTYIRALARDLGKDLKSGAYILKLKRTKISNFLLADSLEITTFVNFLQQM